MYRMFWGACESVQISRFREKIQFDSHVVAVTVIFVASCLPRNFFLCNYSPVKHFACSHAHVACRVFLPHGELAQPSLLATRHALAPDFAALCYVNMALPMKKSVMKSSAMKSMKKTAMKVMKKKACSVQARKELGKIARGKRAKASVFKGNKEKTASGHAKTDLMKNKRGKVRFCGLCYVRSCRMPLARRPTKTSPHGTLL